MGHKRGIRSVAVTLGMIMVALAACTDYRGKVPSDAKPSGFKQLVAWKSCGSQYCSQEIILARNGVSFDDAIQEVETRYQARNWQVTQSAESKFDDGALHISNSDLTTCISLAHFNIHKYRRDLGAPETTTMTQLVEPYSTVILASAGICG